MFLCACLTDEIMTSSRIKQDNNGVSVYRKHTREDLLALKNILRCSVVDVTGCGSNDLLLATGWMVDVALS
jgi:hypothetical protein